MEEMTFILHTDRTKDISGERDRWAEILILVGYKGWGIGGGSGLWKRGVIGEYY